MITYLRIISQLIQWERMNGNNNKKTYYNQYHIRNVYRIQMPIDTNNFSIYWISVIVISFGWKRRLWLPFFFSFKLYIIISSFLLFLFFFFIFLLFVCDFLYDFCSFRKYLNCCVPKHANTLKINKIEIKKKNKELNWTSQEI